jgi:formylglycine-generating enzyme required for sulfatase activity
MKRYWAIIVVALGIIVASQLSFAQKGIALVVEVTDSVGVFPKPLKPGDIFKDCDECPEMIVVPSGNLLMGSLTNEAGRYANEGPQHRVTISDPFAVGIYEVTQAEWQSVMGHNPSRFKGARRPVETVSWDETQIYLEKLNSRTGETYRLLSESEWEYVARAGTTTRFNCGASDSCLDTIGWLGSNSGSNTHSVGSKRANRFGLHDVHGNVWEWTQDCWNSNYNGAPSNGSAMISDNCSKRVLRGGSWASTPRVLRSANRNWTNSGKRYSGDGFRVTKSLTEAELQ